ncbi:MAG: pirin family protein [Thermodesulfobacteriota bacterium]
MIKIRKSDERGHVNWGWLDSYYSFSFGNYYDPENMGFSKLRVINEDWISGGGGFDSHPHSDMEIITYVLDGALEHKDSMGNSSVIRKNDLQKMTAGRGVLHSEYNHSDTDEVHLLQIWITPAELGLKPSYEQKRIDPVSIKGNLKLVASGSKEIIDNEPIRINQDVDLYIGSLEKGQSIKNTFDINRNIWLQLARGSMTINNQGIEAGDGVSISNETEIELSTSKSAEFLLFNMN